MVKWWCVCAAENVELHFERMEQFRQNFQAN